MQARALARALRTSLWPALASAADIPAARSDEFGRVLRELESL